MSFSLGVSMMDSFISLNEGEKDVQHPISTKNSSFVSNASDLCSPLFQPGEDISNNQSVSEIVEEIWKDHRDHISDVLEENVNSVSISAAPEKGKRKRATEKRCKQTNTLMKQTLELHEHTGLSVITIVRDKLGKIVFAGRKDFENLVIEGKPLVEVNKQSVHKWVNENLSLLKKLLEAKYISPPVAEKLPEQSKHSIPGAVSAVKSLIADFVVEQGTSAIKNLSPLKQTKEPVSEKKEAKWLLEL